MGAYETLSLTTEELDYADAETRTSLQRAWREGNNAGEGETPEDYTQDSIDPDAGVNDLAGALDGRLVLRSGNDTEVAVYLVGEEILGVGDAHGLWLVRIGYVRS